MNYQPVTCVWEVTMGCNMRCGHCGSSCAQALPDELNTEEALELCDQLVDIELKWVTLSGGEPLTRADVFQLVEYLSSRGVAVNMITNGWFLDKETAHKLKKSGIATVAISIDGTEQIHDKVRTEGAFAHAREAFTNLKQEGVSTGAVTTITKLNLPILDELKEELIAMGVDSWQLQLGLPMGNLKEQTDWVIEPGSVTDIIRFSYQTAKEGRIKIFPADCIGYYTWQELEVKRISYGTNQVSIWDGCNAGIRGFGILHNGDILGCTSIRSKEFIEGNIKEKSLVDIWEDENAFAWRRNMNRQQLSGNCSVCHYADKCLGGCPNTRLTMKGDIHQDNPYCAYYQHMEKQKERYAGEPDVTKLFSLAQQNIAACEYQDAAIILEQLLKIKPEHIEALKAKGFCDYQCGCYKQCLLDNRKAMEINPDDAYAVRGVAMGLYATGDRANALKLMGRAVEMTRYQDGDMVNDYLIMQQG